MRFDETDNFPRKLTGYLHVLFYGLTDKRFAQFSKEIMLEKWTGLRKYSDFLYKHNGCILYSGAIVMFGYSDKTSMEPFEEPPSLKKMNASDRFVHDNPLYLYIGNLMHCDFDNVNLYVNKKTGYILWMHEGEIFKEFKTLDDMLEHILQYYEPHYKNDGEKDLSFWLKTKVNKLSGGQQRMLSIISFICLRMKSKVFIIDEPLNNLDINNVADISNLLNSLVREKNDSVFIIVSHCKIFPFITNVVQLKDEKLVKVDGKIECHSCFGEYDENGYY